MNREPSSAAVRRLMKRYVRKHVETGDEGWLWRCITLQRRVAHHQSLRERGYCYQCRETK